VERHWGFCERKVIFVKRVISGEVEKRRSSIKPVNSRIQKLRDESVGASSKVSAERARFITEFYKNHSVES